ncbi:hypothetical protein HJA57_001639 [Vibrio vulnificus]|nr:hypothetical protein [Vibrio vulnificus]EGQ7934018.1 hypothetical protein [Vibrio vulnificus]
MKIYSFYFPQFYPIPENDVAWGVGFTDWDNVKQAKPLYDGHYQPRVPLDGYYDQSKVETIARQVSDMKKANLDGVSFYHYWFDGKLVLEKPAENFLANKTLDIEFNFTWANETWSKRWVGEDNVIIFKQTHSKDRALIQEHFNYLLPFFKDERYQKVNNKPVFNIYNPHLIDDHSSFFGIWNEMAINNGFSGIHFVAILCSPTVEESYIKDYEGCLDFQPRYSSNNLKVKKNPGFGYAFDKLRFLPEPLLNVLTKLRYRFSKTKKYSYNEVWDDILALSVKNLFPGKKRYYSAFIDWDNTPRYGEKATIYTGSSLNVFFKYIVKLLAKIKHEDSVLYVNAWNEWSEGTYIEADKKNGYKCIDTFSKLKR